MRTILISVVAFPLLTGATLAQFAIERVTLDSGGGSASGSTFALDATIGQPDATEEQTSPSYEITGGFWAPRGLPDPCPADFDNDGDIDLGDFGVFGAAFGSLSGEIGYIASADFDGDGDVDLGDFGVFGSQFGNGPDICNP